MLYVPPVLTGGEHMLVPLHQYPNKSSCEQYGAELGAVYHGGQQLVGETLDATLCAPESERPEAVCQLLWRRHAPGFDSVPEALLTLFEIATLQGWPIIMHLASDAQGKDLAPRQGSGFQGAELCCTYHSSLSNLTSNILVTVGFQGAELCCTYHSYTQYSTH